MSLRSWITYGTMSHHALAFVNFLLLVQLKEFPADCRIVKFLLFQFINTQFRNLPSPVNVDYYLFYVALL